MEQLLTQTARWTVDAVLELFEAPFHDLIYRAHQVHRLMSLEAVRAAAAAAKARVDAGARRARSAGA